LGVVVGLCTTLAATQTVKAAPMDFALPRLRVEPDTAGCARGAEVFCPNNALFERLMLQFGASLVSPMTAPASTLGTRGFYVGVDTSVASIDNDQDQWRFGTQGDPRLAENKDASGVLTWNRVTARKGLPFGLEVDASLAQAASTQVWMLGVGLKWALVEGFHEGLGRLPDVAIRASLSSSAGARDANLSLVGVDLIFSKPFTFDGSWTVSPIAAVQGAWLFADSDLVDLTPETDAFDECRPAPGHQLPGAGVPAATVVCRGAGRDYANTAAFGSVRRFILRASAGAEIRYRSFVLHGALSYDVLAPTAESETTRLPRMSRQLAANVGLGIAF